MHIIWWIVVGLIAGWATGKIMKGAGYGTIMDIVIGVAGAIIGGFIMRTLGFSGQGVLIYTVLVAILGAIILTDPMGRFCDGLVDCVSLASTSAGR
jgi:uncharacterized membrane protein YeaQ/YmgE (transglycosylase-associated protein family)